MATGKIPWKSPKTTLKIRVGLKIYGRSGNLKRTILYFRPELTSSGGGRARTTYCVKAKMSRKKTL